MDNYILLKNMTNDWLDSEIEVKVKMPKDPHAVFITRACIIFMRALGYSDATIDKYFNTDAIYDDFYEQAGIENDSD